MIDKLYYDLVLEYRKTLHQIPEIGFDLYKTHEYVKSELEKMGYQVEVVAQTGLVVVIKGESDEAIAFRADMDALTIPENTNIEYASKHIGCMHACGHDGHMSMLLGFAKYLTTVEKLNKTIILIFQPAEEGPGGAKLIVEEGIFDKYNITKIFGIHLFPDIEEGIIGTVNGPMLAQNSEINIEIIGVSSHGAQPHFGSDAIVAAANLITSLQTITSRNIDPINSVVLTIGTINGGDANNIIANKVTLAGTIRTFNQNDINTIKRRVIEIVKGIELVHNVRINLDIEEYYPPVLNNNELFELFKSTIDEKEYQVLRPMMMSEDFAYYQQKVPGLFVMLGTKNTNKGFSYPLHNSMFNFNEEVLVKGIEYYIKMAKALNIF